MTVNTDGGTLRVSSWRSEKHGLGSKDRRCLLLTRVMVSRMQYAH
jgi:hypothetical protein